MPERMRNNQIIALFIVFLLVVIPVALSQEFSEYNELYAPEESSGEYMPFEPSDLDDAGMACYEQHKKTRKCIEALDNGILSVIENIFAVMSAICTTMSAIDFVISGFSMLIGMYGKPPCCHSEPTTCGFATGVFETWSPIYNIAMKICCFSNSLGLCGNCYGLSPDNPFLSFLDLYQWGLSPYDNIYTAVICLSPTGILYNIRKLRTIYSVYDCCIQEACRNGLSTEPCEKMLDETTCIYWEGSLYKSGAKLVVGILARLIVNTVLKGLIQKMVEGAISPCLFGLLKLAQIPNVIQGVMAAFGWVGKSFNEPSCSDLGFEKIKKEMKISWGALNLKDKKLPEGIQISDKKISADDLKAIELLEMDNNMFKTSKEYDRYMIKMKDGEWAVIYRDKKNPTNLWFGTGKDKGRVDYMVYSNIGQDEKKVNMKKLPRDIRNIIDRLPDYVKLVEREENWQLGGKQYKITWIKIRDSNKMIGIAEDDKGNKWVAEGGGQEEIINMLGEKVEKEKGVKRPIIGKDEEEERRLREKATKEFMYEFTYEILMDLLNAIIDIPVNKLIEDRCKEEYESSYPDYDQPVDIITDVSSATQAQAGSGQPNIYTAQLVSKHQTDRLWFYNYSYSITANSNSVSYRVYLSNGRLNQTINMGNLGIGNTVSNKGVLNTTVGTHNQICIKANRVDYCFPSPEES